MEMFGVGVFEMMMILIVAVLVVGPERLPQVAADIARWTKRARAYATHLSRDFNQVVSELEKEVGVTREDWKDISQGLYDDTKALTDEVEGATSDLKKATDEVQQIDLEAAKRDESAPASTTATNSNGETAAAIESAGEADNASSGDESTSEDGEQPWYATERAGRRRTRE